MPIEIVEMFCAKCNTCGKIFSDKVGRTHYACEENLRTALKEDSEWILHDGEIYCPDC